MNLQNSLLLSLVIVVLFAGCAKQSSVAMEGVIIEKFTPQVSTVASNSPVELTLIVKNTGEREANDIKAVLGGLAFLPSSVTDEIEEQKYWKLDNEKVFKPLDPTSLLSEDVESGFKGEQGIATWRLTAPIQARDQTYEAIVNLVYSYSTLSNVLIKAADFNYFQSLPENEQKSVETGIVVDKTTKGPIEVSIKSDQAVTSGSSTLPIEINFKNIGGGRTFVSKETETDEAVLYTNVKTGLDKILVELPSDIQCNLKREDGKYTVRLVEGSGRILCNKVVPPISATQTFSLDIKVEYRYLLEGKTTVKVSKTLYIPPIVDISLEDSTVTIEHDHSTQTTDAKLDLKIKNVGNQPVSGTDVKIRYTIPKAGVTDKPQDVLPATFELKSFETYPPPDDPKVSPIKISEHFTGISKSDSINYILKTDPEKLSKTDTKILLDEINTKNNQKTETIALDYDIGVTSLKAEVDDENKLSVKITADIKNNAKNVDGVNIPIIFTVDSKGDDITKCELNTQTPSSNNKITIDKLERGRDKNIVCTYQNPNQKLSFNIYAGVEKTSSLDINQANDYNAKPNGEEKFIINYDVAITDLPTVKFVKFDATDPNKVIYEMSAKVVNSGNVPVKGLTVKFVDKNGNSLCQTEPSKIDLLPFKTSDPVKCTTIPVSAIEITDNKAIVEGLTSEKDKTNNEKKFTLLVAYDMAIIKDSSKAEKLQVIGDQATYTLSTKVENKGTIQADNLQVRFVSASESCDKGKSLCENEGEIPKYNNIYPNQAPTLVSCNSKKFSVTETVKAKVCVIGLSTETNKSNNEEKFTLSVNYDLAIVAKSSKAEKLQVIGDQATYTLSTSVQNKGDVEAKNVKVRFVKSTDSCETGKSLCGAEVGTFTNYPNQPPTSGICDSTSFSVSEIVKAKACVIGLPDEKDKTNNEEQFTLTYLDTTLPTVGQAEIYQGSVIQSGTDYFYSGMISIRAIASDVESGVSKCEYTLDNGATWSLAEYDSTNQICKKDSIPDSNKDITVNFRVTNGAGLSATGTSRTYKHTILPTTTVTAVSVTDTKPYTFGSWTKSDIRVSISCQENGGVNCKTTKYCADNKPDTDPNRCAPSTDYAQPFKISTTGKTFDIDVIVAEGLAHLRYEITDTLGNVQKKTLDIKFDTTNPEFPGVDFPGSGYSASTLDQIYGPAKDMKIGGSGLPKDSVQFAIKRFDNKYWTGSDWTSLVTWLSARHGATTGNTEVRWFSSTSLPTTWEKGKYDIHAKSTDNAGNSINSIEVSGLPAGSFTIS